MDPFSDVYWVPASYVDYLKFLVLESFGLEIMISIMFELNVVISDFFAVSDCIDYARDFDFAANVC